MVHLPTLRAAAAIVGALAIALFAAAPGIGQDGDKDGKGRGGKGPDKPAAKAPAKESKAREAPKPQSKPDAKPKQDRPSAQPRAQAQDRPKDRPSPQSRAQESPRRAPESAARSSQRPQPGASAGPNRQPDRPATPRSPADGLPPSVRDRIGQGSQRPSAGDARPPSRPEIGSRPDSDRGRSPTSRPDTGSRTPARPDTGSRPDIGSRQPSRPGTDRAGQDARDRIETRKPVAPDPNLRDRTPGDIGRRDPQDAGRDARDAIRDRGDTARDRLDAGRDARDAIRDRTDTARDRLDTGRDRLDAGRDARDAIRDRTDTARDRLDTGRDARDAVRDRTDTARDRLDTGRDRLDAGRDARDAIRDRADTARDRLDTGRDARDAIRDRTDTARDRLDTGRDRLDAGRDARDAIRDRADTARDRLDTGRDARDAVRDRTDTARDRLDAGRDRLDAGRDRIDRDRQITPTRIQRDGLPDVRDRDVAREFEALKTARTRSDVERAFANFERNVDVRNLNIDIDRVSGRFQTRIDRGDFPAVVNTRIGRQFNLNQQFNFYQTGDVARRLNLHTTLVNRGGWSGRYIGPVYSNYTSNHFSIWYPGPSWYPNYVWLPQWSPWVSWSYWNQVIPFYDPRPWIVRPIVYPVAQPLVAYEFPVWDSLPVVTSGTWVDVPPVTVQSGFDLQLMAVRFVDPGHPEEDMGPRFRVWVRNNSDAPLDEPFDVTLVAADDVELSGEMAQAGVTIESIDAGETSALDIRLPLQANRLLRREGHRVPFTHLHAIVDGHEKIDEADEANNGAALERGEILPVDPAAFSTDVSAAAPGSMVVLAGEGFGPEPGELIVVAEGRELPAEVHGWYELGVQFRMPDLRMNQPTDVELLVVRGDGAASNPVAMQVAPESLLGELPEAPAPR